MQRGRDGFVDGIQTVPFGERQAARLVLILDRLPPRQTRGRDLIVQHDRGLRQVVEQRLQPIVEKRQPMLDALMLAPGADSFV